MSVLTQSDVLRQIYADANQLMAQNTTAASQTVLDAYARAQAEIIAQIHTLTVNPDNQLTLVDVQQSGRLPTLLQSIQQAVTELTNQVANSWQAPAEAQYLTAYQQGVYALDQATPPSITPMYAPPPVQELKLLANTGYKGVMFSQQLGIINDAMASDVRDEIMQSLVQGESVTDAAARIENVIGAVGPAPKAFSYRALRIARTQMMAIQNQARDLTYDQNRDIVENDVWEVAPSDKTCDSCLRREGMTDDEIEQADPGDDPFGNSIDRPLHPNCECDSIPKLKPWRDLVGLDMPEEFNDDERGMRDPDTGKWTVAPVEDFDAWLERRQIEAA